MTLKKFLTTCSISLLMASCSGVGAEQMSNFVPSMPDVPLPEGFEVDTTTGSFFDSPEGRIAEIYAAGLDSPKKIGTFYEKIMPQFGWKKTAELTYRKEGETIKIEPEKGQFLTIVKYELGPNI